MADFDPLTVPAVLDASIQRTTVAGKPTQYALDWEQALQSWMKANVANTNKRLNLVSDEVDGAYAAVATEATARADADGALASQITTVEASVDEVSANGEIAFIAKATPAGATASFGLYLTAGLSFAGLEAIALSAGGSAIAFTANQFLFTDSGTAQPVLSYSGGKFGFTGAVEIDGTLTINGTIFTDAIAAHAVSQTSFAGSAGTSTSITVDVRSGAGVAIVASFNGQAGTYFPISVLPGAVEIDRDGTLIGTVPTNFEASGTGPSAGIAMLQTSVLCADFPSAGTHTYTITTTNGGGIGGVAILAQELAR